MHRRFLIALPLLLLLIPASRAQSPGPDATLLPPPPQLEGGHPEDNFFPHAVPDAPPPPSPQPALPPNLEAAAAGGRFGSFGGLGGLGLPGGGLGPSANYHVIWLPTQRVTNEVGTHLGFVEQDLGLSTPLWRCDSDVLLGRVSVRSQLLDTNALLPNREQLFPQELWNISLGITEVHTFDNGWTGGLSVSGGTASNKPFESTKELNANVLAFLRIPVREADAWNFSLAYSPLSQLPFPIPGVSYFWHPSDRFYANIGLPLQVHYRPLNDLSLDLSYMLLTTVHARATYRLAEPVRAYLGFNWINEGYHLTSETTSADRFFYYEMNLVAGVRWTVTPYALLDISTGYAFDRFYTEGQLFGSGGNASRVDINPGPFLSGQFSLRW
jgi:hypothetical protein